MWFTLCFICCLLPPENLPKLRVRVVVDAAAAVSTGVCVCLSCIGNAFVYLLRINQIASCQFAGFNVTRGLILAIVVCLAV